MSEDLEFAAEPSGAFEQARPAAAVHPGPATILGRMPPHSVEAEEYVLSCLLLDADDILPRCAEAGVGERAFYDHRHGQIFGMACAMHADRIPVSLATIAQELTKIRQFEAIGGYAFLIQVSSRLPTTAQAGYFIEKVREFHLLRETIAAASRTVEEAFQFTGGIEEFLTGARERMPTAVNAKRLASRGLTSFAIPPDGDASCLLGDRYLNRGDGAILSGSSGMGKSSMQLQAAVTWALGRPFFGIACNGPMRSLIIQSEDSDGDIAEVWRSLVHKLELTPEQQAQVSERVVIVTDRVHRGHAFIAELRRHVAAHKPDLVWINPLQAFIDGDVTESRDLGQFLREGLNGLNEPPSFGYVLVHHTTKPATGKDKTERLWHEVMYDMAGGAELINWARAIMSLRAGETEGAFQLVLAKRGRRAGVTKQVEAGAGWRDEPVTTIALRHSRGLVDIPGRTKKMPLIFWESPEVQAEAGSGEGSSGTKPAARSGYRFSDFRAAFSAAGTAQKPANFSMMQRAAKQTSIISGKALEALLQEAVAAGALARDDRGFWVL